MKFIHHLKLQGLLSFAPDMPSFELHDLNVLIGPNGSGKSNVIEAIELLRATPTDFAAAIREGGGATEWLWKGETEKKIAGIEIVTGDRNTGLTTPNERPLRYRLEFLTDNTRVEVFDEALEETRPLTGYPDVYFYYRFHKGNPVINARNPGEADQPETGPSRRLRRQDLLPDQSVLSQIRDPALYPELTWLGRQFGNIQMLRDWTFGRYTAPRQAQPADLPEDRPLPDYRNLVLILDKIEHDDQMFQKFNGLLKRFFPRLERISTKVSSGMMQFYLHEAGLRSPVPATRLSDGTIRFIALLATLLTPSPPPLICIDEPELGLHPDAVSLVADLMVEASQRTQLIVATHSDALLSALNGKPDSVVACERVGVGTTLRRLDSSLLADLLDAYPLGDLWRMGELGANP